MRLWGRVVSGSLLVFAVVFVIVAVAAPEARGVSLGAAAILVAAGLIGIPWIVRLFMSFTGDEDVLEKGVVGSATIASLKPTGWRDNRYYPIVKFGLNVELRSVTYPVEIRQTVDPELLARLVPGTQVTVRVDNTNRNRVVIDWRKSPRAAT